MSDESGASESPDLRTLLLDVVEDYQDALGYVPDYFRWKWCYDDTLNAAEKALGLPVTVWSYPSESDAPS